MPGPSVSLSTPWVSTLKASVFAIGELNGEAGLDLAVARQTPDNVGWISILDGGGDGTFTPGTSIETARLPRSLCIGDLDADGRDDLVAAVADPAFTFVDEVWVWLGQGNGQFQPGISLGTWRQIAGLVPAEVDEVALGSQRRAKKAWDDCVFQDEVIPVPIKTRKGEVEFRADEHMRPDTTAEGLAALKPYFKKDGLVTAGNASGISDGAAATVISSEGYARAHELQPLGRLVAWAVAGGEPAYMGIGPAPAARKALQKAGMKLERMDLVEVNEAFAPQYLAVERELGLDRDKTNVHGGAIAIGHPLAASGTRITIHLLHALRQRKQRFGLGSACIGGGQGAAVIVEAFPA